MGELDAALKDLEEARAILENDAKKSSALFDHKVQLLVEYFSAGPHELSPVSDLEFGTRYPEAERITGDDAATVKRWLEGLASSGILETRFIGKLLICPKCGSSETPIHYCCPTCMSNNIEKRALFEHLGCGHIDKEENFGKRGYQVCPKCSRPLGQVGLTHKEAGTWFLCRNCQTPFPRPQGYHVCSRCKDRFTVENATLQDVFAYKLGKDAELELRSGGAFLQPIKVLMEDLGYEVTVTDILHGASGNVHIFDLLGAKQKTEGRDTVAVDVVVSDPLAEDSSIATYFLKEAYWHLFAKRYETNPDKSVLIAIPSIHEAGKKLAALYSVTLIEAGTADEAVEKLKARLSH